MADEAVVLEQPQEEVVVPANPFSEDAWKPTAALKEEANPIAVEEKPVVEENPLIVKEPEIKPEEKPVVAAPEPIKFANEESEKVFNLLKEGKTDEVYSVLEEQKKLASAEGADAIKLQLQYQNKDFSADDINDLFNERYAMPEKPVQDLEGDDEFAAKLEKYEKEVKKVENRIVRDAKPAKTELQKLQQEIVLPDIPKTEPVINQPTQEELDAEKKIQEKFLQTVDEGVKNFKGYETTFKDEEVEIKVAYVPSDDERKTIQPLIELSGSNAGEFLTKIGWLDENGNINTAKLAEDLPLILDKGKVFQKIASETGNKRHEASIKAIKNIDYSGPSKNNGEMGKTPQQMQGEMVTHFFSQ